VLASAVIMLTDLAPTLTRGIASLTSIAETLSEVDVEQNEGKPPLKEIHGAVEFRNISFAYPDSEQQAIRDFSLSVAPDSVIAFVGMSGSGKSTLAALLVGFIRPQTGSILFDGVDASTVDYRTIRKHMSVVPQEAVMFDGTIAENVTYGLDNVSEDVLIAALQAANAMEFVEQLPDGIHTAIGPRGFTLSGGQKQRIAIARALIRDPKILVLDEATSALDNESEFLVQQALNGLMHGRTTFVIAHRLSTIKDADVIVVLDNGSIVESGSHESLIALNGHYARLATMNDVLN
jgi:ATP-binding cassette subfamily B protein